MKPVTVLGLEFDYVQSLPNGARSALAGGKLNVTRIDNHHYSLRWRGEHYLVIVTQEFDHARAVIGIAHGGHVAGIGKFKQESETPCTT